MNMRKTLGLSLSSLGLIFASHSALETSAALANPVTLTPTSETVPATIAPALLRPVLRPVLREGADTITYIRPDPLPYNAHFTVYCGYLSEAIESWMINVIPEVVNETVVKCENSGGLPRVDDYTDGTKPLPTSGSSVTVYSDDGQPILYLGSPQP